MAQLLIVYHSRTGGTRQMAEAAAAAAREEAPTILKTADQAGPEDLLQADGYIFCAPENLAAIAGVMKDFYDRCYYPVLGRIEGRPYAQMVCAGSDGENAARQTARIARGWRLKEVKVPLIICTHAQTPEDILAGKTIPERELALCRELVRRSRQVSAWACFDLPHARSSWRLRGVQQGGCRRCDHQFATPAGSVRGLTALHPASRGRPPSARPLQSAPPPAPP